MKKVLILTVIAILALGVMAMATNVGEDSSLVLSGTFNITVQQWIDGTLAPINITFADYDTSIQKTLFTLAVQSNATYKIFMEDLSGLPGNVSVTAAELDEGVNTYAGVPTAAGTLPSGYNFDNSGSAFSAGNSYSMTTYTGKVTFSVPDSTAKGESTGLSLNVTIIAEAHFQ